MYIFFPSSLSDFYLKTLSIPRSHHLRFSMYGGRWKKNEGQDRNFPHSGKFLSFVGDLACVPVLSWLVPSYPVFSHCIHLLNKWKLVEINLIFNYLLFRILLYSMNGWQLSGVSQTQRCRTEWNQLIVCSMRSIINTMRVEDLANF